MVFVMAHMRRWKKESTIFKKAKKLFVVDVLHICAPSDGAMIGVLVYRFVPKVSRLRGETKRASPSPSLFLRAEHALPQPGKNPSRHHRRREEPCLPPSVAVRHPEFRYKTEFQSHEPEFDDLKSLEIEEKINKIKWCQTANGALFLLSTNDKTIKFWKIPFMACLPRRICC
ncbi:Serine/threonine protein phosphatase 2A 55 kDa regulatory subunit B alpha isoform [Arachis hypogaea]|uniref:Serine/threonine protein phosphatase 2A 55 kDa regulatory subunit B alpha isoform n=1 Tax=Arachis hypogaea TaxID=3818 RepID=A0A6B9VDA6_ARAHY|nr:Serine/threonine protein phosphatase 2A 55 kDa regulatory subunit B alpha isoform [Arachis hypogaea]